MDKLLYISTGIPKEEVDRLRGKQTDFSSNSLLPISVFHGNLLSGFAECYDEVAALSGVPISRRNFNVLRYRGKKIVKGNIRYTIPGFFNVPVLKQLTTIVKIWFCIIKWYIRNRKHNCHILIDGTFYTGLIALGMASPFMKAKTGAIVVDYYSFMDPEGTKLSQKLYYALLKCIDRFVFVTDHLEKQVNRYGRKYMIMEGLVSAQQTQEQMPETGDYCLYAGGLHKIYGVDKLVDAFHESELPYSLHLYGNGELIDYIQKISEEDPRIAYKGILPHDQLLEVERGARLLVNPRPVRGELDTRYNFPSKLMEFMQSGRPVITTKLLGIPEEYDRFMFFFEDDTKEKLREGLETVLAMEESESSAFAKQAQKYVNENKNNIVVGKKICDLLNGDHEAGESV